MKRAIWSLALSIILVGSFALIPTDAYSKWEIDDGGVLLTLTRVDNSPHTPYHEIDQGEYGYWVTPLQWARVIDFSTTEDIISPYTWLVVQWIPGPLDWGYTAITPMDQFIPDCLPLEFQSSELELAFGQNSPSSSPLPSFPVQAVLTRERQDELLSPLSHRAVA